MERIEVHFELNEEQRRLKEERLKVLKADPEVKRWLHQNQLDESFLEKHTTKIYEWLISLKKCQVCNGLSECVQPSCGHLLNLVYDGLLNYQLTDCRYQRLQREEMQHVKNYGMNHCSEDMLKLAIEHIDLSNEKPSYVAIVSEVLKNLKNPEKGLYLHGAPGVGKTYLGACITNYFAKHNKSVAFVNVPELIMALKLNMSESSIMDNMIRSLKRADVVLFDDIGGESVTAWSRDEILLPIMNERMEKHRLTYFTSNYTIKELEVHFSLDSRGNSDPIKANRLIERIKALTFEKNVKGCNRRT